MVRAGSGSARRALGDQIHMAKCVGGDSAPAGTRLGLRDATRVRELQQELLTLRLGGESLFATFLPALSDLLGMDAVCAYGLRQLSANSQEVSFLHCAGTLAPSFGAVFSRFVATSGVEWAAFNPGRPEPAQRNRAIRHPWAAFVPLARELLPSVGLRGKTQLRTLVCEDASLLAWVGGWQDGDVEPRQWAALTATVPALHRRLATERQLEQGTRLGILDSALDAIGKAAFVCDARGRIREANRVARELLAVEGRPLRAELVHAVGARSRHARWEVTPVQVGAAFDFLVLARAPLGGRLATQVKRAILLWGLTARQAQILERVAEGSANRNIGAMLGISERTVEVHITALLEKAQAESRAELIAKTYTLD